MNPPGFPTTTGDTLPGYEVIDTAGIVCGKSERALGGLYGYGSRYFNNLADGRNLALSDLVSRAKAMGADGVIRVVFEHLEKKPWTDRDHKDTMKESTDLILATGTAVNIRKL